MNVYNAIYIYCAQSKTEIKGAELKCLKELQDANDVYKSAKSLEEFLTLLGFEEIAKELALNASLSYYKD